MVPNGIFVSRRHRHTVRVAYLDTDQARIAHHASYFRFMENARLEFWRANGLDYRSFEERTGLGLPVAEARMKYIRPVRFDDLLEVETFVSFASRASIWMESRIRVGDDLKFEGAVRLACVHFESSQVRRITEEVYEASLEPGYQV